MAFSSAHSMVWEFSAMLQHHVRAARDSAEDTERRQHAALCIVLSITLVEVFVNAWFRLLVEHEKYAAHRLWILEDLKARSLDHKLRVWPRILFGEPLDLSQGAPQAFKRIKLLRNQLMHFTTTYEQLDDVEAGIRIVGLTDTTVFDELTERDAAAAQTAARGVISELLQLGGTSPAELPLAMRRWTGIVAI